MQTDKKKIVVIKGMYDGKDTRMKKNGQKKIVYKNRVSTQKNGRTKKKDKEKKRIKKKKDKKNGQKKIVYKKRVSTQKKWSDKKKGLKNSS